MEYKELVTAITLVAILLTIGYLLPQTIGLSAGGFDTENVLTQFNFYQAGIGFLMGILLFIVAVMFISKESTYGDGVLFASQGEFPSLSYFKKFTSFRLLLGSGIIFSILGIILLNTQQTTLTGFKVLEHQFTAVGSATYSALLIPIAENAGSALLTAFFLFCMILLSKKLNINRTSFRLISWVGIPLLTGLYGYANHILRYGASDFNMIIVFFFWVTIGVLTVFIGNVIPGIVMHLVNNLLFDLKRFNDSEFIAVWFVIAVIVMIVWYVWLYHIRPKIKGK